MSSIAEQFTLILAGLRAVIAEGTRPHRQHTPMLVLIWGRVGRMAQRFEALFARWRAGTLPKPRAGQARPAREQPPIPPRIPPRLPRGRMWLVALLGYHAAGRASQLQHLLAHPDMAEFLAAAPQAGRILRPLCRLLGIEASPDTPAELNLPNPPRFRPAPPPPPPPIYLGIIDPPEVQPHYLALPRNRALRAGYV